MVSQSLKFGAKLWGTTEQVPGHGYWCGEGAGCSIAPGQTLTTSSNADAQPRPPRFNMRDVQIFLPEGSCYAG